MKYVPSTLFLTSLQKVSESKERCSLVGGVLAYVIQSLGSFLDIE